MRLRNLAAVVIVATVLTGLLAACVPPPNPLPAPIVPTPEPVRGVFGLDVRGLGSGDGCVAELDNHADGYNGGPYNDIHQFPRLKFAEGDYCADSSAACYGSFTTSQLDLIALGDLVEFVLPVPDWEGAGFTAFNPIDYVHDANPDIKTFGLMHSYAATDPGSLGTIAQMPQSWDIYNELTDNSEWLYDKDGVRVSGGRSATEARPNWQNTDWQDWIAPYLLGSNVFTNTSCTGQCWDGIGFEAVPPGHSYAGAQDQDADTAKTPA